MAQREATFRGDTFRPLKRAPTPRSWSQTHLAYVWATPRGSLEADEPARIGPFMRIPPSATTVWGQVGRLAFFECFSTKIYVLLCVQYGLLTTHSQQHCASWPQRCGSAAT